MDAVRIVDSLGEGVESRKDKPSLEGAWRGGKGVKFCKGLQTISARLSGFRLFK